MFRYPIETNFQGGTVKSEFNETSQSKVTEVFEQIVSDFDTSKVNKKLDKSRKILEEVHTIPVNCEIGNVSTRPEVKFNK
jgi:hypothetical protein